MIPNLRHPVLRRGWTLVRTCLLALALALPLANFSGCATEPITGRTTLSLVPEAQVNALGLQAYEQIIAEADLSENASYNEMVTSVGERIAAAVNARMREEGREPFEWEFAVIEDEAINAFALPGGKVAFYTGILPVAEDDAGVAVVMGHEIAHAYASHGAKRLSEQVLTTASLTAVEAALSSGEESGLRQLTLAALGVGAKIGSLAFSRSDEAAADQIGLILMAEAGYDPREAIEFWGRMHEAAKGRPQPPEFLSTHPSHETRIERLREHMPEALEIYRRVEAGGGK